MKFIFGTLTAGLIILTILLGSLYLYSRENSINDNITADPKYHVQIITQSSKDHFWTTLKKGALKAAEELNIYVEFVNTNQKNVDEALEAADKAVLSNVDGFALQAPERERTSKIIDLAIESNIKVVTFESDNYNLTNIPSVCSNSYDIGMMAAETCASFIDSGKVAVIIDASNDAEVSTYKNNKLQGIIDKLNDYSMIEMGPVYTLNSEMFEVDKLVTKILEDNPDINAIICTDEISTPGVAQVLVDSNRVGDIVVIGYGAMPQTLEYIERGVISATIYPDAYNIGYKTVYQLYDALENKPVEFYTTTSVSIITKDNMKDFKANNETEN
ncbi:MAG: sugar transporter substrate-binding protein [Clostridiales bacterium]|jgi:ribose transport system substrate-binding protein|nr:sugar transporter substrate-binding protein [Clostridiales bacterium]